ncbi:unnamed protein product, partial [Medioppia subpectinata]
MSKYKYRLNKEIQDLIKDNDLERNQYCIELTGENKSHFIGKIVGPLDTPFEKGVFKIDITIPDKYPLEPPVCKFVTRVWHPNISSQTGVICVDLLKDQWSACTTIEAVLRSLQSFLPSPNPATPQDAVVAAQYTDNLQLYDRTARYWTYHYAINDETRKTVDKNQFKEFNEKIGKLMSAKSMDHNTALTLLSNNH